MKTILRILPLVVICMLMTGCGKQPEVCSLDQGFSCGTTGISQTNNLFGVMDTVITAIKNQDLITLSTFVGPEGLRFSPYEYVNTSSDVVLTSGEVYNGLSLSRTFVRGAYDGSGEPIDLPIGQYWEKFVYDVNFIAAPEVYHNQKFERGNIINNIFDVYTGKEIVEYHFPEVDSQYEGMDRRSLYLVLENIGGQRYLIGIIHGQWTI